MFKEFGTKGKRSNGEYNLGIKCENELITNESDLTDLFNDYFVNIASNLKEPIVDSELDELNMFVQSEVPTDVEFDIFFTNVGFERILLPNLNVAKS